MRIDDVVINASPLITLFRSGQADLLPQLFKRIVVPQAVWQEVVLDDWNDAPVRELRQQTWPAREHVDISPTSHHRLSPGRWVQVKRQF